MKTRITAAALVAALAGSASAQTASATFDLGNILVSDQTVLPLDTTGVAGDFVAFRVTTDWSVVDGNPFSTEASVFFGDPSDFTIISDTASPANGVADGSPVDGLLFAGAFDQNPGAINPVDFVAQSGGFGDVNFDNTLVEWFTADDLPGGGNFNSGPASPNAPTNFIDLGVIGGPGIAPVIDTFGSGGDTELGVYAADGTLLAANDDAGGTLQSEVNPAGGGVLVGDDGSISLGPTGLGAGDYFIFLSEFNTEFGPDFDVTPGLEPDDVIPYVLNIDGVEVNSGDLTIDNDPIAFRFTVTPAPSSLALLGLGGLAAIRRRR